MIKRFVNRILDDGPLLDALSVTSLVMVEALQFLIVLALAFSFVPLPVADFFKELPPKLQAAVHPKRDIFFYRCFLLFAVGLQAATAFWFHHRRTAVPRRQFFKAAAADACLVAVELFAVFKVWQYDNPQWARVLLYAALGGWVFLRIFWDECQQGARVISEVIMNKQRTLRWGIDGVVLLLLIVCLWVPDVQKALARVFVWEQFRNWDQAIMMPAWAAVNHEGLNTDVYAWWGMGAAVFIGKCAKLLGGFDYARVLTVMMGMVIVYYALLYAFLRAWLGSVVLAAACVAVAVKVQMFNSGISPIIWAFPQDTPLRHWLDVPVLWCLWRHTQFHRRKYLDWAACGIGAGLAWSFSTGLCLLAAFWGYLIFLAMRHESRSVLYSNYLEIRRTCFSAVLPLCVMIAIFLGMQGRGILGGEFWRNLWEPIGLFLGGTGTLSFYSCLFDRHFFAFIAGFVIPLIYVWTLMIAGGMEFYETGMRRDIFVVPLCLYGLAMYLHYLAHASTNHYYAVGVPVVMVLGFWALKLLDFLAPAQRIKVAGLLAILAWGALLTNTYFVYYPNVFDLSHNVWATEVGLYQSGFSFDEDAQMIARLTPPQTKAAVISSFEVPMLMQANRQPFFYYAPLVNSQRVDINGFAGTSLITQERLDKTIRQITDQNPDYIFVDKRLLGTWPAEYARYYPGIILALKYVVDHYEPQDQGRILVALHRKVQ